MLLSGSAGSWGQQRLLRESTQLPPDLALGILGIIVFAGHPGPAARPPAATPSAAAATPSLERLRDYQDRLRVLDERVRQQAIAAAQQQAVAMPQPAYEEAAGPQGSPDPLAEERRRREYESLFASNVVMSPRPDGAP